MLKPHLLRGNKLFATVEKVKELLKLHKSIVYVGKHIVMLFDEVKFTVFFLFKVEYKSKENFGRKLAKKIVLYIHKIYVTYLFLGTQEDCISHSPL